MWYSLSVKCDPPLGTFSWTLGSQMTALTWKFVEPLESGVLLEEVDLCGEGLEG